ncbi:putative Endoplasmic reticulum metallopeptidase 1 [Paratrimastix pyriformis]|uniref:Vacuolar membrane protease n=1 Tax=Paratrimastix pyriformis TaxID=342808 RepID=A0ABQ8UTE9_9EUKA|nr:putative Endoplasmic reticulum metallopeptidase 1 [Paratrimastix pyriformis]
MGHFIGLFSRFLVIALCAILIYESEVALPTPVGPDSAEFSEIRAFEHIHALSALGPHPVGSAAIVLAKDYIVDFVKKLQVIDDRIEIDVQSASGVWDLWIRDLAVAYTNLTNIIVRYKANSNSTGSVLFNGHYDSTCRVSLGASDDGSAVATMMEMLHVLAHRRPALGHDLVFLFNGAEEFGLMGAHAFVTQHPWAPAVKAFVNLEAMGAGGAELLFRAGPGHHWMADTFARVARRPSAAAVAQDVYALGLIKSNTDHSCITRLRPDLPGLDFAFVARGQVYHTGADTPQAIAPGSIQHQGDNMVPLAIALANSPALDAPSPAQAAQGAVFTDILGRVMISYSTAASLRLDAALWAAWMLLEALAAWRRPTTVSGRGWLRAAWEWALVGAAPGLVLAACLGGAALAAWGLVAPLCPNAPYPHPWLAYILYGAPGLGASLLVVALLVRLLRGASPLWLGRAMRRAALAWIGAAMLAAAWRGMGLGQLLMLLFVAVALAGWLVSLLPVGPSAWAPLLPAVRLLAGLLPGAALLGPLGLRLCGALVPIAGKDPSPGAAARGPLMTALMCAALLGLAALAALPALFAPKQRQQPRPRAAKGPEEPPKVEAAAARGPSAERLLVWALVLGMLFGCGLAWGCAVLPFGRLAPAVVQTFHIWRPQLAPGHPDASLLAIHPRSAGSEGPVLAILGRGEARPCPVPGGMYTWATQGGYCLGGPAPAPERSPSEVTVSLVREPAEGAPYVRVEVRVDPSALSWALTTHRALPSDSAYRVSTAPDRAWRPAPDLGGRFMVTHSGAQGAPVVVEVRLGNGTAAPDQPDGHPDRLPKGWVSAREALPEWVLPGGAGRPEWELFVSWDAPSGPLRARVADWMPAWASTMGDGTFPHTVFEHTRWPWPAL